MDYRVATAMRGPDIINGKQRSYLTKVKYHLTGRLRAAYYLESQCYGLYVSKPIEDHEVVELIASIKVLNAVSPLGWAHVASHLCIALGQIPKKKRLRLFGYFLPQILAELDKA